MGDLWIQICIVLISGLEIFSMVLIMQLFFGVKPLKRLRNYPILFAAICAYDAVVTLVCKEQDMLQMLLLFGFLIVYGAVRVDKHRVRAGLEGILSCLLYVMYGFLTQMTGTILGLDGYNIRLGEESQSVFEFAMDIVILVVLCLANRKVMTKHIDVRLTAGEEILLLAISLFSPVFCAGLDRIYHNVAGIKYSIAWVLFAIGVNAAVYAWIIHRKLTRHYKSVSENYRQSFDAEYQYFKDYKEKQSDAVRLRHDLKSHMLTIQGLMDRGEYDKAKKYFQEMTESGGIDTGWIATGSEIVDILLNAKKSVMDENNIQMDVSGAFGRLSQMDNSDCSVLIANLIDNAIEANAACRKDRYIKVRASENPGSLMLLVENPMSGEIRSDGDRLISTKTDSDTEHGIGTVNIKRVVEKYHGECQMKPCDGIFVVKVILPFVANNDRLSQ